MTIHEDRVDLLSHSILIFSKHCIYNSIALLVLLIIHWGKMASKLIFSLSCEKCNRGRMKERLLDQTGIL